MFHVYLNQDFYKKCQFEIVWIDLLWVKVRMRLVIDWWWFTSISS